MCAKSSKTKVKKARTWFIGFIVMVILISFVIYKMSLGRIYPITANKQFVSINSGETYSGLIDKLAEQNKVQFPFVLKIYRKLFIQSQLKAGVYEVHHGMTVREVFDLMSDADNAQMNKIMVIDGTTSKQLLERLRKDPNVVKTVVNLPEAEMMKALDIPYSHLEGLLAPDTYFFMKGETDKKILLHLYHRQMDTLDREWQGRATGLPYKNKYEALIMASIVKKETSVDHELTQVSGVFTRRLQLGMRLQTDPTVIYGMGDRYNGKITKQDLRTPTAYNTYTITGLPPTPIALPDAKSINAVMHPDDSKNVYFVATGNGGHKFSENLTEHNQAVQEYLSVLRSKKDGATP
ncbi:endolytic transglycosylase MltG [Acinetobacter rathckeae]|uniref:endolytic transglycosylase MltG n=1 Tax=Acinetobacter rathckeae TaxID=2605272 RepID=UPI0018A331D9|nr:endolytic transglycosylase MltG [Acinetobacter rathckeae]MBF7687607.1 endolytic transglycosylase MltG [Acinetobacter rathckeae]MBF7695009.1 endolytic transglycosylase MltG [Acinetobacter rathckeae]